MLSGFVRRSANNFEHSQTNQIIFERKKQTPITSNGWTSNSATCTVVADGLRSLIGRDLFDNLDLAVIQPSSSQGNQVNNIPINLEVKVNKELKKLLGEKHIIKLSSCPDKQFVSPIVVTVKKDQTIKLALDFKILNKAIHKKNRMPNIDTLNSR